MTTKFKPELQALAEQFGLRCRLIFEDHWLETFCFAEGENHVLDYDYADSHVYKKSVLFSFFTVHKTTLQKTRQVLFHKNTYIQKRQFNEFTLVDTDVVTCTLRILAYEQ